MTTTLRPAPVPARQFHWEGLHGTAEMSDLNGFGRVYPDACDEGLTVVGATGTLAVFVVERAYRDLDGDVTHWTLVPADRAAAEDVRRLTVYND